jgi:ABC-type nitrate/sulfonate/bicarbonate transport system permease component
MTALDGGPAAAPAASPTFPSSPPPSASARPMLRRSLQRLLTGLGGALLSIAVICGVWQLLVKGFDLDPFLTRGPLDVWNYLTDPANGAERTLLWDAGQVTAVDALIGLVGGTVAALIAAIGFALWRGVEQTLLPIAMALRAVPLVAMTPLIALIFGRGLLAVTVIAGIITFFPVLVNVSLALRATPRSSLDLLRAYGAGAGTTLWRVQLPAALPALFAALRVAAPLALVGALLAEWLATGKGLGYLMLSSVTTFELDRMWTGVTLVTIASILLYTLISVVEQLTLTRYAPEQAVRRL